MFLGARWANHPPGKLDQVLDVGGRVPLRRRVPARDDRQLFSCEQTLLGVSSKNIAISGG
eukprot:SAG22_NODE_21946_length_252_cov_1.352941_1_plen_59_part_10